MMSPHTDTTAAPAAPETQDGHAHHGDHGSQGHHGYSGNKAKYLARLRRIEGQTRGIHRMIDEDQYCIDILTQISAVNSALENVALALLEDHIDHCVKDAVAEGGDVADDKLDEAMQAIRRLVKS